jgi:hypothetical protein
MCVYHTHINADGKPRSPPTCNALSHNMAYNTLLFLLQVYIIISSIVRWLLVMSTTDATVVYFHRRVGRRCFNTNKATRYYDNNNNNKMLIKITITIIIANGKNETRKIWINIIIFRSRRVGKIPIRRRHPGVDRFGSHWPWGQRTRPAAPHPEPAVAVEAKRPKFTC